MARARARSRCRDSLLEEAVSSEPVSEAGFFGTWELRHDSEAVMHDDKAEMGYFGLEYAGFWVFPLGQLLISPILNR
jgi:hypothetical protein